MAEAALLEQPDQTPADALPVAPGDTAIVATETKPPVNHFDQYDAESQASEPGLYERARLNAKHSYYRGTVAGASDLAGLSHVFQLPDDGISPDQKKWRTEQRAKYNSVVEDLARYDLIAPYGSTTEAVAAFGGQIAGGIASPESLVGWGSKGANVAIRTAKAALQQGAITGLVDPIVQYLNIGGGVQKEYDPAQTAISFGVGAIIGGGLHVGGELISSAHIKKTQVDLGKEDTSFRSAQDIADTISEGASPGSKTSVEINGDVGTTAKEVATPEPTTPEQVVGFTTAKGSTYTIGADGTTIRDKAARPDVGHEGDSGIKPQTDKTIYVDGDASVLSGSGLQGDVGEKGYRVAIKDDKATFLWWNEKEGKWGAPASGRDIPFSTTPEVGKSPVELWKPADDVPGYEAYRGQHAGNKITEIRSAPVQPPAPIVEPAPTPRTPEQTAIIDKRAAVEVQHQISVSKSGKDKYSILDNEGNVLAVADIGIVNVEGRLLAQIDDINTPALNNVTSQAEHDAAVRVSRNALGTSQMREAMRQFLQMHPEVEGFTGNRVSGARNAGKMSTDNIKNITVNLPQGEELAAITQRAGGKGTLPMEKQRPAAGVASEDSLTGTSLVIIPKDASPQQADAIRSLQQQSVDLAKALDIPLRQGRIKNKNALGTFNTGSGVVRVREVPDFEAVAHEAGHAIEYKIGTAMTDLTNKFSTELAPMVSNPDAYDPKMHIKEGFAEFIRRYIGNPAHAEQVAPGFTIAFRDFMGKNEPAMLAAIEKAAANYRAYLEAPSVDAIAAVIRSRSEEAKGWRGVVQKIREEGFPSVVRSVVQNIYSGLLDDKAPVARAVRELAKAQQDYLPKGTLIDLKAADNPEVLLRMFERSHQASVRDMMDGVRPYHSTTPEGPSLTGALEVATGGVNSGGWGKWDPEKKAMFSDYLVARRAALLWDKFKRGDLSNPPVAFSKADAVVAMADLERANPRFREASNMVHDWTRELLRKQYEGGLIDADLFNKLAKEEFYVPFMRDLSDKPNAGGGGTRGNADGPGMTDTIKRMKGSSRDIKDPIESLMTQAFLVNRTLAHNDIITSFVRLAEKAGTEGGKFVEKIPARESKKYTFDLKDAIDRLAKERGVNADDARVLTSALTDVHGEDPVVGSFFRMEAAGKRGEPIVFYKEGGQLKAARFMAADEGHALYETLTALPKPLTDAWSQMVAATTTTLRAGITSNPMFALTNYIRDQFAVSLLRNDYVPIVSGIKGIASEFKQGESAVLYGYAGGVSGGASIAPLEKAIENDVNALAKKGYLVNRLTSFKGLLDLAGFTESGTRNSVFGKVFEAKKAQGLSDYEAMIEAAFNAQDILDFSRHGSHTLMVRKYIPFMNAYFQGMDKARRVMVEPIVQKVRSDQVFAQDPGNFNNAMLSLTKVFGVGGVLGAGWAALNSEKEGYLDASPQIKGTHVVVPWGRNVALIPKPFELGIGFTAGEYAYQAWAKDDPRAAKQFGEAAWDSMTSGNPFTDIPILKQVMELKTGKSLFTGKDIVPTNLQRLAPAEQYFDKTSSLAKVLGKQINVSPIKIDYAIGSTFGLWGRDIMAMSSGVNPDSPAQSWEDMVFLRRLIKDPSRTSDVTTKFWEFMGQTSGKYNQNVATYDNLIGKFQDNDAKEFLKALPEAEKAFVVMKSAANEDGKAAFKADEKRLHPLQRAYDAVTLLNGIRRELTGNTFRTYEDGTQQKLPPDVQRDLIENVRELAQMEMRNSFVIMKTPGYAGRPLLDVNLPMEKIKAIDSNVAAEIATRYATAKVYKTDAVAQAFPKLQSELLRDGSEADLGSIAGDVQAEGYQFDGERAKKPQKRRVQVH